MTPDGPDDETLGLMGCGLLAALVVSVIVGLAVTLAAVIQ